MQRHKKKFQRYLNFEFKTFSGDSCPHSSNNAPVQLPLPAKLRVLTRIEHYPWFSLNFARLILIKNVHNQQQLLHLSRTALNGLLQLLIYAHTSTTLGISHLSFTHRALNWWYVPWLQQKNDHNQQVVHQAKKKKIFSSQNKACGSAP